MVHPYWPLFDLRIVTPRLEMRYPDDAIVTELARVAALGIHDPETMPFSIPWTDVASPLQERNSLQHYWRARGQWSTDAWGLPLAAIVDGEVVGMQGMNAEKFALRRTVVTGSWLRPASQGQGIGREMRQAVLHLAFVGLGAVRAESGAFHDNVSSIRVSRAVGYTDNGDEITDRRDGADRQLRFVMTRDQWEPRRRDDIVIENLAPCLEMMGLEP
jgi:RimJ/RimL family protein N-acetyltransferase